MALGLQTESGGSGDFNPICKYDARAGRMFKVDREQGAAGWETKQVEITNGFQAIFDLENIEVGWALFANGMAPSWSMVPLGHPLPPKPSDQHKQTFRMLVKLGASHGGEVRELASQAKVVISAIDALHTQFEAERGQHPGQLPVVALTGTTPITTTGKGQSSTNYQPVFQIVKWVDRPVELPGRGVPPPANQAQAAPIPQARTTSQVAPAPVAGEEF